MSVFNPTEHFIHFDGFMEQNSLLEGFETFLKKEKFKENLKHLQFLLTMKKIDDIDESDYESYVTLISKEYFEIFPSHLQNKFLQDLEKFNEEKISLHQLLKDFKIQSTNELRYHCFPLYIRNKECHVRKKKIFNKVEIT